MEDAPFMKKSLGEERDLEYEEDEDFLEDFFEDEN